MKAADPLVDYVDEVTGQNGFSFNLYPIGLGRGVDSGAFQTFRR